jgi:hypothetical protein
MSATKQSYGFNPLGSNNQFAYNFQIFNASHIRVIKRDANAVSTVLQLNIDYTVSGVGLSVGGVVTLTTPITAGENIFLYHELNPLRNAQFGSSPRIAPFALDQELDRIYTQIRLIYEKLASYVKLGEGFIPGEFDTRLPKDYFSALGDEIVALNATGDGFVLGPSYVDILNRISALENVQAIDIGYDNSVSGLTAVDVQAAIDEIVVFLTTGGGSLPPLTAGDEKKFLEADDITLLPIWQSAQFTGFSARFGNAFFNINGIREAITAIFNFQYVLPGATLTSNVSTALRERGDAVTSMTLSSSVTRNSDPILDVTFYAGTINPANIIGATQTGNPNSGVRTQAWTGSFNNNFTFNVRVRDDGTSNGGTPQNRDVSLTYSFVYPYYFGAALPGRTPAQVAGLTKQIIGPQSSALRTFTFSVGDVFYFAYPASISALVSILDINGFENLSNFTLRTENITGLDGNPVSYRIYEFNNPAGVSGTTNYTFIR